MWKKIKDWFVWPNDSATASAVLATKGIIGEAKPDPQIALVKNPEEMRKLFGQPNPEQNRVSIAQAFAQSRQSPSFVGTPTSPTANISKQIPSEATFYHEENKNTLVRLFAIRPELIPYRAKPNDSGLDLRANIADAVTIKARDTVMISTGVFVAIRPGWEGQVRSKSGLAAKSKLMVLNSPGTIDADYRGEIKIILHNAGKTLQVIQPLDKIAQLVICPISLIEPTVVDANEWAQLTNTERGDGGFGSTGR